MRSILLPRIAPRDWRKQWIRACGFAGLILIGYQLRSCNEPPPVVQEIAGAVRYVPKEVITRREPDAKVGRIESIGKPRVRPDYVAKAKHGPDSTVAAFCAIRDYADSIVSDSGPKRDHLAPNGTVLLTRSLREDSRLFPWQHASAYVVGVSSNGDLSERRYQVRQGWQYRTDGDSLVVQQPRIPVKPIVGSAIILAAGYALGRLAK